MSALILASSLTVFWFLAGLMLPGYALRIRCAKWIPFSSAAGDTAVHAMALGLLWSTLQFFVVHALALDLKGQPATAWLVKQGTDAALIAFCSLSSPGFWKNYITLLTGLVRQLCQPLNLAGMALALSFAAFAIFQFPYASDNAALYWMAGAVMKPGVSFLTAQGSPGYIAWLYWPQCYWLQPSLLPRSQPGANWCSIFWHSFVPNACAPSFPVPAAHGPRSSSTSFS
ncbi:hypothetical protein [Verrucomicrobium spinosum]|uniref:hypothetical protein n=1 Tax=Verrucomicrobium spinosum TaxID=2736 RepID=UPI0009465B21|nr:hypothetical protein [Verrucomicrobium spinosum]